MIISSMNATDLYNYNQISTVRPQIPSVKPEDVSVRPKQDVETKSQQAPSLTTEYNRPKTLPIEQVTDFAIEELGTDIGLIGSTKDIRTLDVDKIVSDMQKDGILQDYQYFVGNIQTEDGIVTRR